MAGRQPHRRGLGASQRRAGGRGPRLHARQRAAKGAGGLRRTGGARGHARRPRSGLQGVRLRPAARRPARLRAAACAPARRGPRATRRAARGRRPGRPRPQGAHHAVRHRRRAGGHARALHRALRHPDGESLFAVRMRRLPDRQQPGGLAAARVQRQGLGLGRGGHRRRARLPATVRQHRPDRAAAAAAAHLHERLPRQPAAHPRLHGQPVDAHRRPRPSRRRRLAVLHRPPGALDAPPRREHLGPRGRVGDRGPPHGARRDRRGRALGTRRGGGEGVHHPRRDAARSGRTDRVVPHAHSGLQGAALRRVRRRLPAQRDQDGNRARQAQGTAQRRRLGPRECDGTPERRAGRAQASRRAQQRQQRQHPEIPCPSPTPPMAPPCTTR